MSEQPFATDEANPTLSDLVENVEAVKVLVMTFQQRSGHTAAVDAAFQMLDAAWASLRGAA